MRSALLRVFVPLWCGLFCAKAFAQSLPASSPTSGPSAVKPPQIVSRVDAVYPPEALAKGEEALVALKVSIGADGTIKGAEVVESGGDAFDRAALAAVFLWTFTPAYRGEIPIESKIKIPFRFALPKDAPQTVPASGPASAPATTPARQASQPTSEPTSEKIIEVIAKGKKAPPPRAPSDFALDREILQIAPKPTAEKMMEAAPGVYVAKAEGDAVAGEIFLRGFDAEHGQDIELTVGPIPINQPSHIHGQGYADIGFVIPELVRSLRVTEGVYDPRQGDFAVAGSVTFDLGVEERGYLFSTSFGSFNTIRQLALWAPENEAEETFAAVAIKRSDGFGENRGSLTGSGIAQYAFDLPQGYHGLLHVAAYGSRASFPGVLRLDDIEAGLVDFYGVYDDPSAGAQSAFSTRTQAALSLERASEKGDRTGLSVWFMLGDFLLRENFTGYLERGQQNSDFSGRGDLIEQKNKSSSFGAKFFRRSPKLSLLPSLWGNLEAGMSFRTDLIDQTQNLLAQPQNEIWDQRVDATINGSDLGTYLDADLRLPYQLRFRGGLRADVLYYNINDRLGNFIPEFGIEDHFLGFTRSAIGVSTGPRATLEWQGLENLTLQASYGEGYRSPQARLLSEGEEAPYTKVRSMEIGGRALPFGDKRLQLTGALYGTFLSDDLAFDAGEGGLTFIGPTRRLGAVLQAQLRPLDWLLGNLSFTFVHATLLAPPLATAENPVPPFEPGQLLPFVPPVVARADIGAKKKRLFFWGEKPVEGKLGLGASYLSPRPLPYSEQSDSFFLIDASASLKAGAFELGIDGLNLLNTQYAASEFSFVSDWGTSEIPSFVPERHIAAGAPLSVLATFKIGF